MGIQYRISYFYDLIFMYNFGMHCICEKPLSPDKETNTVPVLKIKINIRHYKTNISNSSVSFLHVFPNIPIFVIWLLNLAINFVNILTTGEVFL